ncbi:MAG: hypothetical protein GXP29_05065 [Planctomycetes bacterium]|nr:hypothetical protein [Planctomycetota bacterium]
MNSERFEDLKAYVGFNEQDAVNLGNLSALAKPLITGVVRRFYEVQFQDPAATAVLGDRAQMRRLEKSLARWIGELFVGPYDQDYFLSQLRIGQAHVRVGLPQRFMPMGMEVIRKELMRGLRLASESRVEEKLESLQKILVLDLTIMLGSYQQRHAEKVVEIEREVMESKLARAQHLAEIGQLAASLAHEIKNPLAGISGAIQIIGESLSGDSPYRSIIRDILGQIGRLDETVKDLLLYARPAPPTRKQVALDKLVPRVAGVLQEEPALRKVKVNYKVSGTVVSADEAQLEQLLVNLILNAAHAHRSEGSITVAGKADGESVTISVRDRGVGMSPEILARALEPFYTTKAKGTGLGLAICRRIVESHGGTIAIDSTLGEGTTITVTLPQDENLHRPEKN